MPCAGGDVRRKLSLMAFLGIFSAVGAAGSLEPFPVLAEFDAVALRWVVAAAPELEKFGVDPARYKVRVVELTKTVAVSLRAAKPGAEEERWREIRGNPRNG